MRINPIFILQNRIDAHIHLYDTNREGSCEFLNPVKHKKIYYPHFAKEFSETASPAGVNYAVVVDASKRREDNFWAMEVVNGSDNLPFGSHFAGSNVILDLLLVNTPAIIIRNDSVLVTGDKLPGTFDRLEVAEFSAKSLTMGTSLGIVSGSLFLSSISFN